MRITRTFRWFMLFAVARLVASDAEDWPMLAHDVARSGASAQEIRPPFVRKWYRLFADEGLQSGVQPVIAGGAVYVGTLAGTLHAIDATTGQDRWQFRAGGPILHAAAVGGGRVFFGSADGQVYAVKVADGKQAWSFRTGAAVWNAPVVHAHRLLVGSRDGWLYALNETDGTLVWRADTGGPLLNSPAVDARTARVYIGSETMRVHAFAVADGRRLWTSEQLPGASMRGYHPVVTPDGSVLVTTAPVVSYDRCQEVLLDMVREIFGDFASWRHQPAENDRLRAENFRRFTEPETYAAQLAYLRRRLTEEPALQTFFVLDPDTGRQRFVAPIVASESMNGPGAPPVVTPDGRVIVKFQALLRSRYEHYSPFLNIGYLDPQTGNLTPVMDQSRTYGWYDSLLLVHDEQSQLSVAGRLLFNTHQDNVNALDLTTLKGYPAPMALNVHEPAPGEALAIQLALLRGTELPAGEEWLMRGTAVYGGGSVLDQPVAIAGDSFYYLPTHELNSGCALVAYRMQPGASPPAKVSYGSGRSTADERSRIHELPWDWDTLATPRCTNLLASLDGPVPGTTATPLTVEAERAVAAISDQELDAAIWNPAFDPAQASSVPAGVPPGILAQLGAATRELIGHHWRPFLLPAGKAPEEVQSFFDDPDQTLYALMLARPYLGSALQGEVDRYLAPRMEESPTPTPTPLGGGGGESRTVYEVPARLARITVDRRLDALERLYPLWLWSRTPAGSGYAARRWGSLKPPALSAVHLPARGSDDDCGNARLAGCIAFCRLGRAMDDPGVLGEAVAATRAALRKRLVYELAHTRGGVMRLLPGGRAAFARWRHLTPDVARFIATHAQAVERHLLATYVDHQRPGWWLAWNVEQLMRNEVAYQLPSTPLEIFAARALIAGESGAQLARFLDLPWCRADEFYLQKLALIIRACQ